jgi:predicted MFS family arabinose efflux permease
MAIGRWYGGIVLKKLTVDHQLAAAITLQLVSFMIFWLSHNLIGSLIALFGVGLGISTQFSLSSVRLITLSNNKPDLAIARSSIAAGLAIGLAPFMLGVLGDQLGISRAYMMVPVLILISLAITLIIPSKIESLRA